jgi:hypothetical protein
VGITGVWPGRGHRNDVRVDGGTAVLGVPFQELVAGRGHEHDPMAEELLSGDKVRKAATVEDVAPC